MSKINETNYPRRPQSDYEATDMLIIQEAGGNTYTTRIEDLRDDYEATLAPTIDKINDALAPAENGATASQSYAIGEHFMRDGAFCTAIAAITSGGSFTLNTNYKVDDVANNLEQLTSDLTPQTVNTLSPTSNIASTSTIRCYKVGKLCTIQMSLSVNSSLAANAKLFTGAPVPYGSNTVYTTLNGIGKSLPLAMNSSGEVYVDGTAGTNSGWMNGQFVYVTA